jgi:hypothetical protein
MRLGHVGYFYFENAVISWVPPGFPGPGTVDERLTGFYQIFSQGVLGVIISEMWGEDEFDIGPSQWHKLLCSSAAHPVCFVSHDGKTG